MVGTNALTFLITFCQSVPIAWTIFACSPAELVVRWCAGQKVISVTVNMIVMMAAKKILLFVTTVASQALPYAGTAAGVLQQSGLVMAIMTVSTDLMSQILIPDVRLAQKRALCPAQVFLEIAESFVMAT